MQSNSPVLDANPALSAAHVSQHGHASHALRSAEEHASPALREELWLNLARAASAAGHEVEVGLRPHGLSPTQLNVLQILREAGDVGLCQYQIGERLIAQVPDVPRILDRMERAGWVQRERGTQDRRLVMARLTEQGLHLAGKLDGIVEQLTSRIFARLTPKEIGQLNQLLAVAQDTAMALSEQDAAAHASDPTQHN